MPKMSFAFFVTARWPRDEAVTTFISKLFTVLTHLAQLPARLLGIPGALAWRVVDTPAKAAVPSEVRLTPRGKFLFVGPFWRVLNGDWTPSLCPFRILTDIPSVFSGEVFALLSLATFL